MTGQDSRSGKNVRSILVAGITSLRAGAMETDNLGNFIIIEPLFRSLRARFPNSRIQTTLQLSGDFSARSGVEVLEDEQFWQYNARHSISMLLQLVGAALWRIGAKFGADLVHLRRLGAQQRAFSNNDIIVDFSGDLYGDNALNIHQFLMATMLPMLAVLMRKPIVSVASSPGPFASIWKLSLAKMALGFFEFVSVREPISLALLNGVGLRDEQFYCRPCFSWGFDPIGAEPDHAIDEAEPLLAVAGKPLVGLILCNLNLRDLPPNKWPREDREFAPFVELITHMVRANGVRVCVFAHRNKVGTAGEFVAGSDHSIIARILGLIPQDYVGDVFTITGVHNAATMNRIISRFEMLISGRIHGAVQGIMQNKPTLIIDYGMEPKAHKLQGFAMLCGLYEYICDPTNAEEMRQKADRVWERRAEIAAHLASRVPELVKTSQAVWDDVAETWNARRPR